MRFLVAFLCICIGLSAQAQIYSPMGARAEAIGQVSSPLIDAWSTINNPAALVFTEGNSLALSYRNNYFSSELGTAAFAFQKTLKKGSIGIGYSRYGYQLYNENQLYIAYGIQLGENTSLGLSLTPHFIQFANTPVNAYPDVSLGFLSKASDKLSIGASLKNPFSQEIDGLSRSYTESLIQFGANYELAKEIGLFSEIEKNFNYPVRVKLGGEYKLKEIAFIRAGVITAPVEVSYGLGVKLKDFSFDLGLRQNLRLGNSGQLSIQYKFSKAKAKNE